jgi:PAS domain S-box-containing protein
LDANDHISGIHGIIGSLLRHARRARRTGAALCLAIALIFGFRLAEQPVIRLDLSTLVPFLGLALSLAIFFLVRAQIRARESAEYALTDARAEAAMLHSAVDELQAKLRQTGDAEQAIAHTLALQEKWRCSEALHLSLVETLPFFIFRKDLEGRFTFANDRFCKHINVQAVDLIGKTDLDLFPLELASKYRRDDLLVRQSESNLDVIETHQAADGSTLYVHVVKSPFYDLDGKLIGVQGVFWDVTERRRAEEKLAAEKERLHVTVRSIGDGVISTDTNGIITMMNQVAEELTGWTQSEAKGHHLG